MPIDRFYLDGPLEAQSQVTLRDQELHHLAHVARAHVGDEIELMNGRGVLAQAKVSEIKKNQAILHIYARKEQKPSTFSIVITQAIPRPNRLDAIVEKGTELGMDELRLFPGQLSEKKELKNHQLARLEKIAVAAAKQSGRLFIPTITLFPAIKHWQPPPFPLYFGDLSEQAPPLLKQWNESPPQNGIFFVVGPESGLHREEMDLLRNLKGIGVKLHQNILRTDTAPLAALTLISHARL